MKNNNVKASGLAVILSSLLLCSCGATDGGSNSLSQEIASSGNTSLTSEVQDSSITETSMEESSSETISVTVESSDESIDRGTLTISVDSRVLVGYSITPKFEFSNPEYAETLEWSGNNDSVIDVNYETGECTGVGTGAITLTAFSEHFEASVRVSTFPNGFSDKVASRSRSFENAEYPEEGRTLFMGDSFFDTEFWSNFYTTYSGKNAYTMGISATTAEEWYFYVEDLLIPYAPENIVIHIGTNDINDDHCTAAQASSRLTLLFNKIHEALPNAHIYYFGIEPSTTFSYNLSTELTVNETSKEYATANSSYFTYLDSPGEFSYEDGSAVASMFRDGLHPTLDNYSIFVNLLTAAGLEMTSISTAEELSLVKANGGSLLYEADLANGNLTLDDNGGGATQNRLFISYDGVSPYYGEILVKGRVSVTKGATSDNSFFELYAATGPTEWSSNNAFQLIVHSLGGESGYTSKWWGLNNSVKQTFGSTLASGTDSFYFTLICHNNTVYFQYDDEAFVTMSLGSAACVAFSVEKADASIGGLSVSTSSSDIVSALPA